jgi:hypothetical protein
MPSTVARIAMLGAAAACLTWPGAVLAREPVYITYHRIAGAPIVCDSDTTPATFDVGMPGEGETEMRLPFAVGNNSAKEVTDVVITLTGSQVPGNFWISYTNNRGTLYPNSGVAFTVTFRPLEDDPSGTVYGGDAAKMLIRVTYNYKPKKGPRQPGPPLELILIAHKR